MGVYVDDIKVKYKNLIMCHMVADTLLELHEMADKIGLSRNHFQFSSKYPHYDICKAKRKLAIREGAIEKTTKELCIILKNNREEG